METIYTDTPITAISVVLNTIQGINYFCKFYHHRPLFNLLICKNTVNNIRKHYEP